MVATASSGTSWPLAADEEARERGRVHLEARSRLQDDLVVVGGREDGRDLPRAERVVERLAELVRR